MAHSSDYSHIWAETNNPLTIDEIAACLGIDTDNLEELCMHGNINKFEKYKPIRYNTTGVTGKSSGSDYWKAYDGSCGLSFPFVINRQYETLDTIWRYLRPQGIAYNEWLRILDFDGYVSRLETEDNLPTGYLETYGQSTFVFQAGEQPHFDVRINPYTLDDDLLRAEDIYPNVPVMSGRKCITDWYVGLFAISPGGGGYFFRPLEGYKTLKDIRDNYGVQTFYATDWPSRGVSEQFSIFPYLFYEDAISGKEIGIGFGGDIKLVNVLAYSVSLDGYVDSVMLPWVGSRYEVEYSLRVVNGTDSTKTARLRFFITGADSYQLLFDDLHQEMFELPSRSVASLATDYFSGRQYSSFIEQPWVGFMAQIYSEPMRRWMTIGEGEYILKRPNV